PRPGARDNSERWLADLLYTLGSRAAWAPAEKTSKFSVTFPSRLSSNEVNAAIATSLIKFYESKTSSQSLETGADRRLAGAVVDNTGRAAAKERAPTIQAP